MSDDIDRDTLAWSTDLGFDQTTFDLDCEAYSGTNQSIFYESTFDNMTFHWNTDLPPDQATPVDWETYPATNQPVLNEGDTFDNMDWNRQGELDPTLDVDFPLLPAIPAALVEPLMGLGEYKWNKLVEPSRSTSALEVLNDFREPSSQSECHVYSENDGHDPDGSNHYQVQGPSEFWCMECSTEFPNTNQLYRHAQHKPCECSCGMRFSRIDSLNRHCASFREDTRKFPCKFCKSKRIFVRRDHLIQHLEHYHAFNEEKIREIHPSYGYFFKFQSTVCPHIGCEFHRDDELKKLPWDQQRDRYPFKKHRDFTKHMREVHKETPFPCPVGGCERVGARGYMREKGLINHLATQHPGVSRDSLIPQSSSEIPV